MRDRLEKLRLLPPPLGTPWVGPPSDTMTSVIDRPEGPGVTIEVPLFWDSPNWYRQPIETADTLAAAVALQGVSVSALRSELCGPDDEPDLHSVSEERVSVLPRIVPYRSERYGLSVRDFDDATIIDLRLTMHRDETGRFAYSPEQIERWEATPEEAPLAGGGWVPAATFPPDVSSVAHLHSKIDQLRMLSPDAAVFVSIGPTRIDTELPQLVASRPDGIILRLGDDVHEDLAVAAVTLRSRCCLDNADGKDLPLWIAAKDVSPEDAAKLIALGASAVAIDGWCDRFLLELEEHQSQQPKYSSSGPSVESMIYEWAENDLQAAITRVSGLVNSMRYVDPSQRLGSYDRRWVETLGITPMLPESG